ADTAKPCQKSGNIPEAEQRTMRRVRMMKAGHMHMNVVRAAQYRKDRQTEADQKAEQINVRESHAVCPFKTCNSLSARPGVSRIAARRMKHFRLSSCRATFNNAP